MPAGKPLTLSMCATTSAFCCGVSFPGCSGGAGIVWRIRSNRSATVWPFQVAVNSEPVRAGAPSPPFSLSPWQVEHSRLYIAAPRLSCASVKTPLQTERDPDETACRGETPGSARTRPSPPCRRSAPQEFRPSWRLPGPVRRIGAPAAEIDDGRQVDSRRGAFDIQTFDCDPVSADEHAGRVDARRRQDLSPHADRSRGLPRPRNRRHRSVDRLFWPSGRVPSCAFSAVVMPGRDDSERSPA